MTPDELLARIDERTISIFKLIEAIEKHMDKTADVVEVHSQAIATINSRCAERHPKGAIIRPVGTSVGIMGVIYGIIELIKMLTK